MPPGFRRESRPFGKRCELRPANFGMHPSADATISAAHHILPPDNASPVDEGGGADNAGNRADAG
jgi:hypothetical protein